MVLIRIPLFSLFNFPINESFKMLSLTESDLVFDQPGPFQTRPTRPAFTHPLSSAMNEVMKVRA